MLYSNRAEDTVELSLIKWNLFALSQLVVIFLYMDVAFKRTTVIGKEKVLRGNSAELNSSTPEGRPLWNLEGGNTLKHPKKEKLFALYGLGHQEICGWYP